MGQIDTRTEARAKSFELDDPRLLQTISDPAFGTEGRIGVEIEFVALEAGTERSLGMAGAAESPGDFMTRLAAVAGADATLAKDPASGYPCGLVLPGGGRFCLENGGQIEYASTPQPGLDAIAAELEQALALCERASADRYAFLSHGTHPTLEPRLDPLVPNARYGTMERFFAPDSIHRWGNYACSIQINLDVPSEGWARALRLAFALSRHLYGLFANSRYLHGERFAGASARHALVEQMDPGRRAVPLAVILADDPAAAYRDWALDVSVIFAGDLPLEQQPRRGELSFRRWVGEGYQGGYPALAHWGLHLGTLWPDVRPRRFLELRTADAQPFEHVMAVVALAHAFLQTGAGRERLTQLLMAREGVTDERAAIKATLSWADPASGLADRAFQARLLSEAAQILLADAQPRWAAVIDRYAAFHAAKETAGTELSAADFAKQASCSRPAEAFRRGTAAHA